MKKNKQKIMIVAGEASGDSHAANLVSAIRQLRPNNEFEFFGATGMKMRENGVETIVKADQFGIVGVPEVARALPMFWNVFRKLKAEAAERRPDAVVLVDFPEFNLKLARPLKKMGIKVIYYISPQLWAWRKYRARTFEKYVDLLLTILPFEKEWYAKRGITNVRYVGHPITGEIVSKLSKEEFCRKYDLDVGRPIVALLAGSRRKEVARILPVLIETAAQMASRNPDLQFVNALATTRDFGEVDAAVGLLESKGVGLPKSFLTIRGETIEVLNAADAAAVTSGTATLETAVVGTPLAMVYRTSGLNFRIFRPLVSVEHFGLVNLIAGKALVKELIQNDFTAENLSDELFRLLEPPENKKMRGLLEELNKKLGNGGASTRAAEALLKEIE